MAAGLPCVAARVGGIPELIEHGRSGLLFPRDNVHQLSAHLMSLIGNTELRRRLAGQATRVAQRFSMGAYVDSVLSVYEMLLSRRSRSGPS